ncbi:2-octaprenyl-6-methoxyphenol hydroxylase [Thermomonas hydrothermalis]|uniref:2-octaprenyl-6-methoxyphenol hydroxylase n=2 Tax=Thermomonas hydrothermalis TaxID=213588 RepID=A0A1M4X099_9GAMM|nr:2-octaprenyl-6-methoxyphenol hydroxylase [Thermomonas hydrothermalis]
MPSPTSCPVHDVLIIGGGLVGASLAIALEPLGLDVGLVEMAPADALPPVFDQRNLSFAEATVNALKALGVLPLLRAPAGQIRRIHISRVGDFGRIWLNARDYGREAFGLVVVARDFGQALDARLTQLTHLTRYRPARFVGLGEAPAGRRAVRISTDTGEQTLQARLLVAADGADSALRAALGIAVERHDYGQTLFVARLQTRQPPDGTAYERLTDHGPTALLPRGDGHYGLVHAVSADAAAAVAGLEDAAFLARVQDHFGWRAGRFLAVGPRSAYPLQRSVATGLTTERAVLVGNAAQAIHPLGAQGFNLGLRDALTLAECIADSPADPGAVDVLERHVRRRAEDRQRTLAFSDGLARLTANPSSLLRPLRSLGLVAGDGVGWLQGWLVGGAMGYRGDVPALCRKEVA